MLRLRQLVLLSAVAVSLSGCMGYEKGNGIDRLDTITQEDKEEEKWFGDFYGSKHCVWGEDCSDASYGSKASSSGSMAPADAGVGHDSGSSGYSDPGSGN